MDSTSIICAISTPPGSGAVAIIRLSGDGCILVADKLFESPKGIRLSDSRPNTVHFGRIKLGEEVIDEVLVTVFHAPHSYTGEESVEIACHGSVYVQQRILTLLLDSGASMAAPGEFTKRAFLGGKMDLSQAEGVADLIASSSAAAHRMAVSQMRGGFSDELKKLRTELLEITALLELELDFSEEDVEFADRVKLKSIATNIDGLLAHLCASFKLGNALKRGVPVAIVGHANVGKSTLLNALLKEERAIVSDVAGTTRDAIEDTVNLHGIMFRFIDTAGLRHTDDVVENMGIERTIAKVKEASIVLFLTDFSVTDEAFADDYQRIRESMSEEGRLVVVLNKTDAAGDPLTVLERVRLLTSGETILPVSAKTGVNLSLLTDELVKAVNVQPLYAGDVIVSNARHYEALSMAKKAIERVISGLDSGISGEFVSQDIRECTHYLGEITGEITNDEVLGEIFSKFCVGK